MKIAVVCKSDLKGGAAVVSYRLMTALREEGVDARMVVCDKLSSDSNVIPAGGFIDTKLPFISERLRILSVNGWKRDRLWQIDPATDGLPLARHPFIKDADAIILNWVNQGMLSTSGLEELLALNKPVIWTMHDKWNMTSLCHHTGDCEGFIGHCENCPLVPQTSKASAFVRDAWLRKHKAYRHENLHFVAVSSWLAGEARRSKLMAGVPVTVIPNAFPYKDWCPSRERTGKDIIAFGAARLDDPVKGLPHLLDILREFTDKYPEKAAGAAVRIFGNLKNPQALDEIKSLPIEVTHLGTLSEDRVRDLLEHSKVILSTSLFETLPTTLIEGQAAGAWPISFDRGGQSDIIENSVNGYLIPYGDTSAFAKAISEALDRWSPELSFALHTDVRTRFSAESVAHSYLDLIGLNFGPDSIRVIRSNSACP